MKCSLLNNSVVTLKALKTYFVSLLLTVNGNCVLVLHLHFFIYFFCQCKKSFGYSEFNSFSPDEADKIRQHLTFEAVLLNLRKVLSYQ